MTRQFLPCSGQGGLSGRKNDWGIFKSLGPSWWRAKDAAGRQRSFKTYEAAGNAALKMEELNMAKHTPGPWKTGNAIDCAQDHAVCAGPHIIARVVGYGYPTGKGWAPQSQANARLIAAAPRLLKELKSTLANLSDFLNPNGEFPWSEMAGRQICQSLRDVIQEAED